jgi:hypothetical protein
LWDNGETTGTAPHFGPWHWFTDAGPDDGSWLGTKDGFRFNQRGCEDSEWLLAATSWTLLQLDRGKATRIPDKALQSG